MYLMKLDDYEMRIEVGFGQDYQVLRPMQGESHHALRLPSSYAASPRR